MPSAANQQQNNNHKNSSSINNSSNNNNNQHNLNTSNTNAKISIKHLPAAVAAAVSGVCGVTSTEMTPDDGKVATATVVATSNRNLTTKAPVNAVNANTNTTTINNVAITAFSGSEGVGIGLSSILSSSKDSNRIGSISTSNKNSSNINSSNNNVTTTTTTTVAAIAHIGGSESKCQRVTAGNSTNLTSGGSETNFSIAQKNSDLKDKLLTAKGQSIPKFVGDGHGVGSAAIGKEVGSSSNNTNTNVINNAMANNNSQTDNSNNPTKLIITTIEHKIRNLEKRKTKLESYRTIQMSGKELSADQRAAVSKFDAVISTLDFARDLFKQLQQFTKDAEKEQRKQARKDLIARTHAETDKIREVLIIQNIMSCLTDSTIRNDFLNGTNGAIKLESTDLEILDKFCMDVQTRRPESTDDVPFVAAAQKAAELFSMTIDGRQKQYHDTTYENVRKIFQRIQESNFLDEAYLDSECLSAVDSNEVNILESNNIQDVQTINENKENEEGAIGDGSEKTMSDSSTAKSQNVLGNTNINKASLQTNEINGPLQQQIPNLVKSSSHEQSKLQLNIAANTNASTKNVAVYITAQSASTASMQNITSLSPPLSDNFDSDNNNAITGQKTKQGDNRSMQENVSSNTTNQLVAPTTNSVPYNPTTVHAVEETFFNQHSQKQKRQQQFIQQMRPLSEVLGGGNFYFLQDSELDVPDINNPQLPNLPNSSIFDQLKMPTMQQSQPATHAPLVQETKNKLNLKGQKTGQQISPPHNNQNDVENLGVSSGSGGVNVNQSTALLQQQIIRLQEQQQQPLISTHIHSQTFTNQSFPQVTPSQSSLGSNTPSPLFHQKQTLDTHPLFSPIPHGIPTSFQQNSASAQLIIGNDQLQPQQPMIIMAQMNPTVPTGVAAQNSDSLFKAQTAVVSHQLEHQQKAFQQHMSTNDISQKTVRFPFDNSVVIAYEQQLQQLAASNVLKTDGSMIIAVNNEDSKIVKGNVIGKTSDLLTDWCDTKPVNANPTIGIHNVLDTKSDSAIMVEPNKWVDLDASTSTVSVHHMNVVPSSNVIRKNDWAPNVNAPLTTADVAGGYPAADVHNKANQWSQHDINYNRDPTGTRISAAAAAAVAAAACGTSTGSPYQRRNDDRRLPGVNINNYRGNNRSSYNAPTVQQQNTGTGRNNVGGNNNGNAALNTIYYRGEGNNSYYQNGVTSTNPIGSANNTALLTAGNIAAASVSGSGGGGGSSGGHLYANNRTQRSGCVVTTGSNTNINNTRNNSGGPSRNMGFNRGTAGNGSLNANSTTATNNNNNNNNYINSRQPTSR